MENNFSNALISENRNTIIPEKYDYFGHFIGEWSFKWHDNIGTKHESTFDGKWTFSRILEGRGVQDTFVTSKINQHTGKTENEYGTTVRIFNPINKNWDIFYGCTGEAVLLNATKEEDKIVLTCVYPVGYSMKWIFYDICENTFKWENIISPDDGKTWITKARAENACRIL